MLSVERNERNHKDVVQLLLEKLADFNIKDIKGNNELMMAKEKNLTTIEPSTKYGVL